MAITEGDGATQVTVQLSDCGEDDAHAVFSALNASFASDREAGAHPHEAPGGHPTIWTTVIDVGEAKGRPGPATLEGTVNAEVQGGIQAVGLLEQVLQQTFAVQEEGSVAGDQERELQLRLRSK